jgi:outer membrane protein OmpA-like peptidoglycan-associated protein
MNRSQLPYAVFAISAVLAVGAALILVKELADRAAKPPPAPPAPVASAPPAAEPPAAIPAEPAPPEPGIPALDDPDPAAQDPEQTLRDIGFDPKLADASPEAVVNRVAEALQAGEIDDLTKLLGKEICTEETLRRLQALAADQPLRLRQSGGIREIGELEADTRTRWSLQLDGAEAGRDRIYLDLVRKDGKWSVEKLTVPNASAASAPRAMVADALGTADAFLHAVFTQNFEFACEFADRATVSDVKIASLCILFEEGDYRLRGNRPLRALFQRADTAAYLVYLDDAEGRAAATFGLTLRQPSPDANWTVAEINLDQLLVDYANRVAGGDIHYSPLVKNPAGGERLALYFEFDEDEINPRARRQLEIVAQVLRADPGKKLTLSGHADAKGTPDYNDRLSARRAVAVRDFLVEAGVAAGQIELVAMGSREPRRPDVTETGEDNPRGRRVNRRTEIYLDF